MKGFCTACGTKVEDNVRLERLTGKRYLSCDCGYSMSFYITTVKNKTDEEVEDLFQQTELTDSQRGTKRHSSHRKK